MPLIVICTSEIQHAKTCLKHALYCLLHAQYMFNFMEHYVQKKIAHHILTNLIISCYFCISNQESPGNRAALNIIK